METNKKRHNDGETQPREMKIKKSDTQPEINPAEVKLKVIPRDSGSIYLQPPRADKINFY